MREKGHCGTGTAGLGHAELGQRYWDSFYSVKMGKIVTCVLVLFRVTRDDGVFVGVTRTGATRTAVLGHAELGQRFWDSFYSVKMGKDCDLCVSCVACDAR